MLIGRHRERERLDAIVESVRGGMSQALVLRGGAGIGKTTLLEHLIDTAAGLQVIHLVGIESEMQLAYAALQRLWAHHIDADVGLPAPQARAVRSAFGLEDGTTDALMVGLATLTSLAHLAVDAPVVCVVDDAQWLDEESARALAVAARRVKAERLAMVFALRGDDGPIGRLEGLPQLLVAPLPAQDAYEVLAATGRRFDAGVGARIVDESEGNPLALAEFARAVHVQPLAGSPDLLDPLPLGARLEEGFLRQIRAQPRATQLLLLTLAADSRADEVLVQRVGVELGFGLDDAAPAYAAELLSTHLSFRHPLIRSAVYQGAAAEDRRRVHATLATMITGRRDADRCAWHRAAAVIGKDEAVATELEAAAARARARGGCAAAGAFLVRAAQLAPDPPRRAALLLAAAEEDLASGAVTRAEALLEEAAPGLTDPDHRVRAKVVETSLTLYRRPERYAAAILDAVHELGPIDRPAARALLLNGFRYGIFAGRFSVEADIVDLARAAASLPRPENAEPTPGDALLEGMAAWYVADHRHAVSMLRPAVAALESDPRASEVIAWLGVGCSAAIAVGDIGALARISRRFYEVAVAAGAWNNVQESLHFRVTPAIIDGALDEADALLTELDAIRTAQGLRYAPTGKQSEVLAWRGAEAELRTRAAVICDGNAKGRGLEVTMTQSALAVLELSLGNYAAAWATWPADWQDYIGTSTLLIADFTEAAVRGGDEGAAQAALERYTDGPGGDGAMTMPGLLARAEALLAGDDDRAEELYLDSIAQLDELGARGHSARSRLVYGEWLRRRKRRHDARVQLRTAYETFDAMGSPLFAERREPRAARDRGEGASPVGRRGHVPDPTRGPGRATGRTGRHQRRDRDRDVHQPRHRRLSPRQGVPEARDRRTARAHARGPTPGLNQSLPQGPGTGPARSGRMGDRATRVEARVLIGRHRERERLDAIVELVRGGMSQALVLRGGAGIGKTTLLEHLIEGAADLQVVHLVGIESEMQLAYAALHRLLGHHIDTEGGLPLPQARALRSAFGLDDGTTNALMVGLATLTSLANLAVDAPVVCIVDDAQWLDEESAAALAVAGASCQRRAPGDGVRAAQRRRTDRPVGGASATPRRALATARGLRDPGCDRTPVRRRRRRPDRGRVRRQPTRARRVRPRGPRGAARRTIGPPGPLAPRGAPRGTLPRPGTGAATAHAVAAVDAGGREPCRRGPRATGRSRARVRPGRCGTGVRREVAVDEALVPASLDPLGGVPGCGARGSPARARHAGDDDHGPTGR